MSESASDARTIEEIDWNSWKPVDYATLLFCFENEKVLLIRKKRGLGAGKINAPGGRLEKGEDSCSAAIRECIEEVSIVPDSPQFVGDHRFQFRDGYSMHVFVYTSQSYTGVPSESEEAIPIWFDKRAIPYEEMWADDVHWVPLLLKQQSFRGQYIFDGDTMLDFKVDQCASFTPSR